MSVTYICDGKVKDFPIPTNEDFINVTVKFSDGTKHTYNKNSFFLMESISVAEGCVKFKEVLPQGSTVIINSEDEETSEEIIERIDEKAAEIIEEQKEIKTEQVEIKHTQAQILNVSEISFSGE